MNNITEQLADALRDLFNPAKTRAWDDARAALAAYDASKRTPAEPRGPHTPEPWQVGRKVSRFIYAAGPAGEAIAECDGSVDGVPRAREAANARRIVACVNACAGTSTERLESGDYGILRIRWGG